MDRLNQQSLHSLPDTILRGDYDRLNTGVGIVHIGPGAFHRAHQAYYTELALAKGGDWLISAVSMNSLGVADALVPQDGLYTLATLDLEQSFRVVGAIKEILHLPTQRSQVMARLLSEQVRVISLTVTEKGYCLDAQGQLDLEHKGIQADLANPNEPQTSIGLVALAISQRARAGLPPLTVISCDNVSDNGHKLRLAISDYFAAQEQADGNHLVANTSFPNTMVDCITPASDAELRGMVAEELGVDDAWPIKREAFSQWVIEKLPDMFLPAWSQVGVTFTDDIQAYEDAKLRILNLSHSALAYIGPLLNCETVYQAIQQEMLNDFVTEMLQEEVIPTINAPAELDLADYTSRTLQRFRNPNIRHLLSQIAYDGSQKLQIRLMPVLQSNLQAGRSVERICQLLAAWCWFVLSAKRDDRELVDPFSESLLDATDGAQWNLPGVIQIAKAGQLLDAELADSAVVQSALEEAIKVIGAMAEQ